MEPPRRPQGSGGPSGPPWKDPGYNKSQPKLAPSVDASRVTRSYPEPSALVARRAATAGDSAAGSTSDESNIDAHRLDVQDVPYDDMPSMIVTEGESQNPLSEAARVALAAKVAMSEEDLCPVCRGPLPDEGRGVIQCGHVFCFECIHAWCKTESACPLCRRTFYSIIKTLGQDDIAKHNARIRKDRADMSLTQIKRGKRKSARYKKPKPFVTTKTIRVRPRTQTDRLYQELRSAPHPQAPGGAMYNSRIRQPPPSIPREVIIPPSPERGASPTSDLHDDEIHEMIQQQAELARRFDREDIVPSTPLPPTSSEPASTADQRPTATARSSPTPIAPPSAIPRANIVNPIPSREVIDLPQANTTTGVDPESRAAAQGAMASSRGIARDRMMSASALLDPRDGRGNSPLPAAPSHEATAPSVSSVRRLMARVVRSRMAANPPSGAGTAGAAAAVAETAAVPRPGRVTPSSTRAAAAAASASTGASHSSTPACPNADTAAPAAVDGVVQEPSHSSIPAESTATAAPEAYRDASRSLGGHAAAERNGPVRSRSGAGGPEGLGGVAGEIGGLVSSSDVHNMGRTSAGVHVTPLVQIEPATSRPQPQSQLEDDELEGDIFDVEGVFDPALDIGGVPDLGPIGNTYLDRHNTHGASASNSLSATPYIDRNPMDGAVERSLLSGAWATASTAQPGISRTISRSPLPPDEGNSDGSRRPLNPAISRCVVAPGRDQIALVGSSTSPSIDGSSSSMVHDRPEVEDGRESKRPRR